MSDSLSAAESGAGSSRRPLFIVLSVVVGVAVLIGLFFLADAIVRGIAEKRVSEEIVKQLPEGVTATPEVTIGGTSVITQYFSGAFNDITIAAPDAVADGIPANITLYLVDFPVDTTQPVGQATGKAVLSAEAVNDLVSRTAPNAAVELGNGDVSYAASSTFLGFTVGYRVTGELEAAGDTVLVKPTGAEVTAGGGNFDLTKLLDAILGSQSVSICTAQYLPDGVSVADIDVTPSEATVRLEATNIVFNDATLQTLGSCTP